MDSLIEITIPGEPRTKKNSQRIIRAGQRNIVIPSKAFEDYQKSAGWFIKCKGARIDAPCEISAQFYMKTRRRVDLVNLLEALDDILTHYGVIVDDNAQIVTSHDGSRVRYDKQNPRTEIKIKLLEEIQNAESH